MPLRIVLAVILLLQIGMASWVRPAQGDYVLLRSGGEIRGELQSDLKSKSAGERVTIRTLSGATVDVVKTEVESVVRRRMIIEEYETRRRAVSETVAAHWELAEWCRQKSLSKEREAHLLRVVELDPEHTAAHRALGHIRHQGKWMSHDAMMAMRGYVKHKGRYVLPQELELIVKDEHATESEKSWFRRVKMWHGWLESDQPGRQAEALAQLKGITEPDAVPALTRSFQSAVDDQERLLYVQILGKIEGDKPIKPLVVQSLWDEARLVRQASITGLRHRDTDKLLPTYIRALKHGMNVIVNRAGAALGELGNASVIPQLIDALVTQHQYTILVPVPMPRPGDMVPVGEQILPPNIARLGATGQLPYGVATTAPPRMREVTVEKDEENPSVLGALTLLTGENFGYDAPAWRKWYNAQHNLKRFPTTPGKKKVRS